MVIAMRVRVALVSSAALLIIAAVLIWHFHSNRGRPESPSVPVAPAPAPSAKSTEMAPTQIYAHNLKLQKGPKFRIYVRWLRGEMERTHRGVIPSFDDLDSFAIKIKTGVLRANIGDIGNFLNASISSSSPLRNVSLSGDGNQIKLRGTLHKIIPIPVEIMGELSALPDSRIQVHVTKINVLKIPLKGLLGDFHVQLADLFNPKGLAGIQVSGNDIFLDSQQLLPPPRIRGQLTAVRVLNPDLEEVFGNAQQDVERTEQWRNFLRLRDGSINFGKLTMNYVDLIMVDISKDAWFDLDLAHYQEQLVNGYTHMTPEAGLQIFMPDVDEIPQTKTNRDINMSWIKNRNMPPPPDVYSR